jgi:hypothetical protein
MAALATEPDRPSGKDAMSAIVAEELAAHLPRPTVPRPQLGA